MSVASEFDPHSGIDTVQFCHAYNGLRSVIRFVGNKSSGPENGRSVCSGFSRRSESNQITVTSF